MNFKRINKKGIVLIIVLIFILLLVIAASSFIYISSGEIKLVRVQNNSTKAFYMAEAGIERTLYELDQDFENDPTSPSWSDGDINGIDVTQGGTVPVPQNRDEAKPLNDPSQPFYALPYGSTTLDGGSYSLELLNVAGKTDEIYLKATGTYEDSERSIVVKLVIYNTSPWNAAVFGGAGMGGVLINGNVGIAGSVHILGTGLADTDYAMNMSGSAIIRNNYEGIPLALSSRIPACPTTVFDGENVQSLAATLRIKNGLVGLSGSATAGEVHVLGNIYKETLDGAYVTDGYGGTAGAGNVYSDNGTSYAYDLGNDVSFPSLGEAYTDPSTGIPYATYLDYLKSQALIISDSADLAELAAITPDSNFSYTDGINGIAADGSGNLAISGIVYIQGGDLGMTSAPGKDTLLYSGSGTILAEGDADTTNGSVNLNVNLYSNGTFPTNHALGVMTPGTIIFDAATINVIGAFYGETKIDMTKQTNLAGTLVSNYIDMGSQVPSVYQVPALSVNLPAGMIDSTATWSVATTVWQEI
jgi:hypothetical protein